MQTAHPQAEATLTLSSILATLPPEARALVEQHLAVPPWQIRASRLAERDEAIREARAVLFAGWIPSRAAAALARDLVRYAAAGWPIERHLAELPPGSDARRAALHRILRLNRGKTLKPRRIHDLFEGRN